MRRDRCPLRAGSLGFLCAILLSSALSSPVHAEDYYLTFPEDYVGGGLLQVTILTDAAATGSVDVPGLSSFQPFSIAAGDSQTFIIPTGAVVLGSDVTIDRAVHVSSDVPLHVIAYSHVSGAEDAFTVLESAQLGTDYVAVTYEVGLTFAAQFAVVAASPGITTVTITPSGANNSGFTPGVPYERMLLQGEVYQLQASVAGNNLSGSLISADQPVAVFSGNELGNVPVGVSYADYLMTQLRPTNRWGDEYIVARTQAHLSDRLLIQALGDGTVVTSSDGLNTVLDSGESVEHTFNALGGVAVHGSGPIQVTQVTQGQLSDGTTTADPAMGAVVPRSAWERLHRVHLPDFDGSHSFRIGVVAPCASAGAIEIDGVAIPGGQFIGIPSSDACAAIATTTSGMHTVTGPDSFGVFVFGHNPSLAYLTHSYGVLGSNVPPPSPAPVITSIKDVPNDQGRRVRLEWDASLQDSVGSPDPITGYAIFRRYDPDLSPPLAARSAPPNALLADWDYVVTVPAFAEPSYATNVETLADSTIASGLYESVFFVRAMTGTPWNYFDSAPDSGYSIDNLAPIAPQNFLATHATGSGNQLAWNPAQEPDFMQHRIYRGSAPDFVPSPGNQVATVTGSQWTDPNYDDFSVFYKVTTVDFSGNESAPAGEAGTTDVDPGSPLRTQLLFGIPNPFRDATTIPFSLARESFVKLSVYDVRGRRVSALVSQVMPAGRHEVRWSGVGGDGHRVPNGTYFLRFEADGVSRTLRVTRLD